MTSTAHPYDPKRGANMAPVPVQPRSIYTVYSQIMHNARVREGSELPQRWLFDAAAANYLYAGGFVPNPKLSKDIEQALKLYKFALYFLKDSKVVVELNEGLEYDSEEVSLLIKNGQLGVTEFSEMEFEQLKQKVSSLEQMVSTSVR